MRRFNSILILCAATGCSSQLTVFTEQIEIIHPADFAKPELSERVAEEAVPPDAAEVEVAEEIDEIEILTESAIAEIEEFDESFSPLIVGVPITVEALIGQVNGTPVYVNAVLEPISDLLKARSQNMSVSEFSDQVRFILYFETKNMGTTTRGGRMYELVISDLLLSEAMSGMTKEQSYGLFAIVSQMRQDLASSQGGSQTQMRIDIEEQAGITVDEFLEFQRDQILIEALYRQQIWPKVNVTWRDIQREFEQVLLGEPILFPEENTERTDVVLVALQSGASLGDIPEARGSVAIGLIRVKTGDPLVVEINELFAKGVPFADVAEFAGVPNGGAWDTFRMGLGGVEDIGVSDEMKKQLANEILGNGIQPIVLGKNTVWITALHVTQPVSVYNRRLQIDIRNRLQWRQFTRQKERFLESLWGEGSLDEVISMADSVANIAIRRYQQ